MQFSTIGFSFGNECNESIDSPPANVVEGPQNICWSR